MKHILRHSYILTVLVLVLAAALLLIGCGNEAPQETPGASYTVTFDSDGGTAVASQTVSAGMLATEPEAPTKEGYTFAAWTLNGVDYDFTAPVNADTTLKARWVGMGPYTVTFKDADGTVLKTESVAPAGAATAPDEPTRAGYAFLGWDMAFDRITGDLTVTAQYVRLWTVTFEDYNGTVLLTQEVRDGGTATAPADPEREHHDFKGWDTPLTSITANTTITATYEEHAKYTVTFEDYDGTVLGTDTVYVGGTATAPADPERDNHTFVGWDTPLTNITAATTITAVWHENGTITVTFKDYDGTVLGTDTVYVGGTATAPADPEREHHDFKGWDTPLTNITESIVITATYEEHVKYTVTFEDYDGRVIDTVTCYTGTQVAAIDDPVRDGYTFAGWKLENAEYVFSTPVTASITLTASYTKSAYTATYTDERGNTLKVENVADGMSPVPPTAPYKAHYAFSEWVISAGSIASGHVTYAATYAPVTHVVTFAHANGTGTATPVTVDDCDSVAAESAPVYSGYAFLYWMTARGEQFDFSTQVTKDITLYAKYEKTAEIPTATTGTIVISPGYLEFWQGLALQLNIQANVTYTESATKIYSATTDVHYDGMTYTFYTDNPNVLTIAADGTITPVSVGVARVWAVIGQGGTQTHASTDYTNYDTFTVADGTVLSPIEVRIIEKPVYLNLAESDPENQQIQLSHNRTPRIDIEKFLSAPTGDYGSAGIALWYNDATAVLTITVDDNLAYDFPQWEAWAETYGTPISIMAITRDYQKYVNRWANLTATGNQVQPHGHSHHSSAFYKSGYLTSAQAWHDSYVSKQVVESATGERVLVLSYPCGYNADFNKYLYIGGRGVSYLPVDSANINYNSVDLQNIPSAENFSAMFDPTVSASHFKYGGWANFLQHGIGSDKSKYDAFLPVAKEYIDNGELWAALFSAACQYGQERDTADITDMNAGRDLITFNLTDKMNDLLFDHALTVKIKVDATWTDVHAYQNGKQCEARIVTEGGETYVHVNAVPDKGQVTVVRTAFEGLTESNAEIRFTPASTASTVMTHSFSVDASVWTGAYAVQNGNVLPTNVTTHAGVTTLSVTFRINDGEVVIVPLTDQYDARESFTMFEVYHGTVTPDGTKPVLISSAHDLVMLSDYVMQGGTTMGITFRLTDDIDMAGVDLRPIGWQSDPSSNGDTESGNPFSGTLDGASHTIYNLHIENDALTYVGLFGYTVNATITRLDVIGAMEGLGRVGGIVGRMVGGTINGVTFTGSVTGIGDPGFEKTGSRVGGLVGQIESAVVRNSAAYASVVAYTVGHRGYLPVKPNGNLQSGSYVGGIFGEHNYINGVTRQSAFDNVVFDGSVTAHTSPDGMGADYVGGFGGLARHILATNVTVNAVVTGNTYVGGFVGHLSHENFLPSSYKNCAVAGAVTGNDKVGGFAGYIDACNPLNLYNCLSMVTVNASTGAVDVGAVFGGCPYGSKQSTTIRYIYYMESLNPGMAEHNGTISTETNRCISVASTDAAVTALNAYATANGLSTWRLADGIPSASYFPVFTVTILDKDGNVIEEQAVGNTLDVILPEPPFITGYEFESWRGSTTNITCSCTIQMIYREVETFTVTFKDKDGGTISTQEINTGRGAVAPTPTEYERFWFTGWDKTFDTITEDTVVTAQYADAYYVTFIYLLADGTETSTIVKTKAGATAIAPDAASTETDKFTDWDKSLENVTSDFTVTARYITISQEPSNVNILMQTLTSNPSNAYYTKWSGNDIIFYSGNKDLSTYTLPEGWAVVMCGGKANGWGSTPAFQGIVYNTTTYSYNEEDGTCYNQNPSGITHGASLAVPLTEIATNKQIVFALFTIGTEGKVSVTGNITNGLSQLLGQVTTAYPSAAGIILGLHAESKHGNTGHHASGFFSGLDNTAFVEGYDLVSHCEISTSATDSGKSYDSSDYILTYMKSTQNAVVSNVTTAEASDSVSTLNGISATVTISFKEE